MEAWRTDRQLIALIQRVRELAWDAEGNWRPGVYYRGRFLDRNVEDAFLALKTYIDQNRARLEIPAPFYVSPRTFELYTPEGTNWLAFAALYGSFIVGGFALQAALAPAAAVPAAATAPASVSAAAPIAASSGAALSSQLPGIIQQAAPYIANAIAGGAPSSSQPPYTTAGVLSNGPYGAGGLDSTTMLLLGLGVVIVVVLATR